MNELFYSLLSQAEQVSYGKERNRLLQQAVALAEEHDSYQNSYQARLLICESAYYSGYHRLFFDHFFWCLSFFEQYEDEFQAFDLLKRLKWALELTTLSPFLQKNEMDTLFSTFHAFLLNHQFSLRSYYELLCVRALRAGHLADATQYYSRWIAEPVDILSDCEACAMNLQVSYYAAQTHYEHSCQIAAELLEKKLVCEVVPNKTYGPCLLPLLDMNRVEQAQKWHQQGLFFSYQSPLYIEEQAYHLLYLVRTNLEEAHSFLDDHLELAHQSDNLHAKFHFYLACLLLAVESNKQERSCTLDVDHLIDSVCQIGHAFDQRNENDHYRQYVLSFLNAS